MTEIFRRLLRFRYTTNFIIYNLKSPLSVRNFLDKISSLSHTVQILVPQIPTMKECYNFTIQHEILSQIL